MKKLVLPMLIVIGWWWAGKNHQLAAGLFPTIDQVWHSFLWQLNNGSLMQHLTISGWRVAVGFGWATVVAVPLGIAVALMPWSKQAVSPLLHFLRQIPPVAWIPLFLLWFGMGEGSKTAVIFYAALFPIFLNTLLGVEQIPRAYWEVAELLQFPTVKILTKLVLPGSAAAIIAGLRLGMGMSWRALVAAEMLAASSGLGYLIMSSRSLVRLDDMVVGILVIGVIGSLVDLLFVWVARLLLPWNPSVVGIGGVYHGKSPYSTRTGV